MDSPSVAIIIVNWNAYKDTLECLKSLGKLTYNNFYVFIVDNGSTDCSFEILKGFIESENNFSLMIELIRSEKNLGFAGGNNLAIKKAYNQKFEYIWLLNNDTIVDTKSLSLLVDYIDRNKQVGIVGSKIYYYGSNVIWFAGGEFNQTSGKTIHLGMKEVDKGEFNSVEEVDYITGCSMLFRSDLINDIGYMREDYFLYYEETDYNIKAKRHGWKIVYVPDSIVYHKVSGSSGGENDPSPFVAYYKIRNGYWICKRNFSGTHIISFCYMLYKSFKLFVKIFAKNQPQKWKRIHCIYSGVKDALVLGSEMGGKE
ncbi:glycosyltransferase family 2 protein [Sporolactobacillus sp. KGMB 08714]|uniref:glycosyltransferase family 2 protein n=1 Tax=Sporolactobacillus sp. KGMB 08714 TaxID=3064704 RepID=UPI002FBD6364